MARRLVEQTEALNVSLAPPKDSDIEYMSLKTEMTHHVVVRLLLGLLLLLLLLGSLGGSGVTASTASGSSDTRSGGTASTDVGEQVLDVLAVEGLGEEGRPDRLKLDLGGRGEGVDLLALGVSSSSRRCRSSLCYGGRLVDGVIAGMKGNDNPSKECAE